MADASLAALSGQFVDRFLDFHPGAALALGRHEHDLRLEDLSESAIVGFCRDLDSLLARVDRLAEAGLTSDETVDRGILASKIRSVLHDYRVILSWRRDPSWYSEVLSGQLNSILIYDYAPREERLRAVVAKQRQVPMFADRVRANLRGPAPIMIRYGIQGMEGALTLIQADLPRFFAGVGDAALKSDFSESTTLAASAIQSLVDWMKSELVAGDLTAYALGREAYQGWLSHSEMIETPIAELEEWALGEIEAARAAMRDCAATLRPGDDAAAVIERVTGDHPATGAVVSTLRKMAEDIYRWMEQADVVSIPAPDRVHIDDTPDFMRWSFGSMWGPGPFEKPGVRSTFYATDADPEWPVEKQNEHLAAFCHRGLENLTIHEAYPGHFIQGLHQNRVDSLLRKCFWWGVFGEGWAHYCELMALEQGFGGGAADARMIQLQEALNRLCRFVNGIRLHTRPDWSTEDGTAFFREKAWMTEAVARAESERGTFDPFYLRYTLGKKLILDLREECRRKLGSRFSLKGFHDALLGCGSAPMPALARLTRLRLGVAED